MKTEKQNTNGSAILGVIGVLMLAFGLLFIFMLGGIVGPGMYEMSEDIFTLWNSETITGEEFIGDYTPVELNNSPILEDTERVYSDYLWSEYNCTADPWASISRTEDNCTCGCENATYKYLVSWWEFEGLEEEWVGPCVINFSWQMFWEPEDNYTCDCGCPDTEDPWMDAIGVYDWNVTNESWDYNFTICYPDIEGMIEFWYNGSNFYLNMSCNISAFYNVSEDDICFYDNVTDYYFNLSTHCNGSEDCGCEEGEDWWEGYDYQFEITRCTDWDNTNCSCDGELYTNITCADIDYTWYRFDPYNESCEESAGNLTIATACNELDEEWLYYEGVFCYNETNYDPEEPPWNYTGDLWFYSECIEEGEGEYNETDDYTMNYEDGEINITEGGNMFEGWEYLIDYDIFDEGTGYAMREANAASMQTGFNVTGLVLVILGFVMILAQFQEQVEGMFSFRRGGRF